MKAFSKNPIKGLGKFEGGTYATRFAYDNPDDEIGSVDELGWYGKFSGKIKGRGPFHIIVNEDSQGFVSGEMFKSEKELNKAWREIEKEYETYYNENSNENPRIKISRKLSQGEAIKTRKHYKKNPLTSKTDIVLQEKRGQSWFTMATFNKIQKEFAVQLGKHLHRKYPNKAFRILG